MQELFNNKQIIIFIAGLTCILLFSYIVLIYNNLVRIKRNIDKAWANIEVLLKQRADELIKLVAVCKKHMQYEAKSMTAITIARTQTELATQNGDAKTSAKIDKELQIKTRELFAVAEEYPSLTTNSQFITLQKRVSQLEEAITDRRLFFNECVTNYNNRIKSIPDFLFALIFGFMEAELMEFEEKELETKDDR